MASLNARIRTGTGKGVARKLRAAGEIPARMVAETERVIAFHDIAPQAPVRKLGGLEMPDASKAIAIAVAAVAVLLALGSGAAWSGNWETILLFINGEAFAAARRQAVLLRELADRRRLDGRRAAASGLRDLLYDWRRCGFLTFEESGTE